MGLVLSRPGWLLAGCEPMQRAQDADLNRGKAYSAREGIALIGWGKEPEGDKARHDPKPDTLLLNFQDGCHFGNVLEHSAVSRKVAGLPNSMQRFFMKFWSISLLI